MWRCWTKDSCWSAGVWHRGDAFWQLWIPAGIRGAPLQWLPPLPPETSGGVWGGAGGRGSPSQTPDRKLQPWNHVGAPPLPAGLPYQTIRHPLCPILASFRSFLHWAGAEASPHFSACWTVSTGSVAAPDNSGDSGKAVAVAETHLDCTNSCCHGGLFSRPGGARTGVCCGPQSFTAGQTVPDEALQSSTAGAAGGFRLSTGKTCSSATGGNDAPARCWEGGGILPLPQGDRGTPVHLRV